MNCTKASTHIRSFNHHNSMSKANKHSEVKEFSQGHTTVEWLDLDLSLGYLLTVLSNRFISPLPY